ncbi:MAG TPA: Rieske 2Fe-2S domain-containing protein [Dehalococcoidia bacterium]|nr:Rieske 2Fe-2S domain-containing protein [Dehalococcoidia bacterium]
MLSNEENDLLCRVGPGTPMGDLMREYWMPAVRSDELPAPDCAPVRVRLLGENLIAYRATSGKVGLLADACPHRGASMFFGRNEEEGLRCVYHGWKFDAAGTCVDMPSEPAESNFKNKVHIRAYQCAERNGIIWAYMGPREVPPPLPDIEANLLCQGPHQISILYRPCNWMQGLEGEMDTVHAAFLHFGASRSDDAKPGSFDYYHFRQRDAKFVTVETDYGVANGAYRPAEEDSYYWRVTQILFPFYHMIPGGTLGSAIRIGAYVPMDDDHHMQWEIGVFKPNGEPMTTAGEARAAPVTGGRSRDTVWLPNTTDWYGRFNLDQNMANDYQIDREAQRTWQSYTGIRGIRQQDMAMTETMGTIYNRSREHLGTTDAFIIRVRRKLIAAAKAHRDQGIIPYQIDHPEVYRQRSGEMVLSRSQTWWDGYLALRDRWQVAEEPVAAAGT